MSDLLLGVLIGLTSVFVCWVAIKICKLFDDVYVLKNKIAFIDGETTILRGRLRNLENDFKEAHDVQPD